MAGTLDDLVTTAQDIKAELSKLPEHFEQIKVKLDQIPTGGDPDAQAKIDAVKEDLDGILQGVRQAVATADQLDGEPNS